MNITYKKFQNRTNSMKFAYPSTNDKFNTVISKNTFYFYNEEFEEHHEGHISLVAQNVFFYGVT
ncbi:MAG: hypothetical protein ACP5JP_05660, partial [bacterium]